MIFEKFSRTVVRVEPQYPYTSVDSEEPISSEYKITGLGKLTNSLIEASENPSPNYNQIETAIQSIVDILNSTPPKKPTASSA